ncbi:MAG: TIGR03667 family PPOX class F420-dependent oxidoreductase [Chloroflexota bacterium]
MIDFNSPLGQKIRSRLEKEKIIWLTTVDVQNMPQPRPVWFHWNDENILIFSQTKGAKVRHITHNPHVALNFNTDGGGGEVGVITGDAVILEGSLPLNRTNDYLQKYKEDIQAMGWTLESIQADFSVVILVTPKTIRGF